MGPDGAASALPRLDRRQAVSWEHRSPVPLIQAPQGGAPGPHPRPAGALLDGHGAGRMAAKEGLKEQSQPCL